MIALILAIGFGVMICVFMAVAIWEETEDGYDE